MAIFAPALRNVFVDLPAVRVLVAGQTAGIVENETHELGPAFHSRFLVATDAGYRQVTSGEWIFGLTVLLNCEFRRRVAVYGMAILASTTARPRGELGVVVIYVTILAPVELQLLKRLTRLVALVAGYGRMLAQKRELRFAMVEIDPINTLPSRGVVASLAVLPELVGVRVLVTIEAFSKREPLEFDEFLVVLEFIIRHERVALVASYAQMPPG